MNKKLIAGALAAIVFASADANAFYVGLAGGTSKAKVNDYSLDADTAFTVSGGIALPIPLVPIRTEVEYMNLKSSDDQHDVKTQGFAANGYIGLPLLPIVKPYLGFGLASLSSNADGTKSDSKIVPQYMAGLDIDIPLLPISGGIEYRYIDATFDYGSLMGEMDSKIHSVLAKVRYNF